MTIFDPDVQAGIEARRQQIIENAVWAADQIILDRSDGSGEEIDFLTAQVAEAFMKKALQPYTARILKKDMGL